MVCDNVQTIEGAFQRDSVASGLSDSIRIKAHENPSLQKKSEPFRSFLQGHPPIGLPLKLSV